MASIVIRRTVPASRVARTIASIRPAWAARAAPSPLLGFVVVVEAGKLLLDIRQTRRPQLRRRDSIDRRGASPKTESAPQLQLLRSINQSA
jgi:hypothetical protein